MPVPGSERCVEGSHCSGAMRRQVITVATGTPPGASHSLTIKYKVRRILVDTHQAPPGGWFQTDLRGGLFCRSVPFDPGGAVIVGPPLFCRQKTPWTPPWTSCAVPAHPPPLRPRRRPWAGPGVLAYPDIVGMLYRFCRRYDRASSKSGQTEDLAGHLTVREVMTRGGESQTTEPS